MGWIEENLLEHPPAPDRNLGGVGDRGGALKYMGSNLLALNLGDLENKIVYGIISYTN